MKNVIDSSVNLSVIGPKCQGLRYERTHIKTNMMTMNLLVEIFNRNNNYISIIYFE